MTRLLALLAAGLAAAALALQLWPHSQGATPAQVASRYVKEEAANATGVKLLGDKVWRVVPVKGGYEVVIRAHYLAPDMFGFMVHQWATFFVWVTKSGYSVDGQVIG